MIRNQKIKGTFICGRLFFKCMDVFHQSLYAGVHLLRFLNALTSSSITHFFKCIKFHQMLPLFSTINLQYIFKIFSREQGQHLMQQKRDSFGITFYKNILPRIFLGHIFNSQGTFSVKLIGVQFKSPMKLGHRIGLVDDYC